MIDQKQAEENVRKFLEEDDKYLSKACRTRLMFKTLSYGPDEELTLRAIQGYVYGQSGCISGEILMHVIHNLSNLPGQLRSDITLNVAVQTLCRVMLSEIIAGGEPPMTLIDKIAENMRQNINIYINDFNESDVGKAYYKEMERKRL